MTHPTNRQGSTTPEPKLLAVGTVSIVHALDKHRVVKRRPSPSNAFATQAFQIEINAYNRLGIHPQIATLHAVADGGIILERGESLRGALPMQSSSTSIGGGEYDLATRLRWALEAAQGLRYIHEKGIVHADVGCHNLILVNGEASGEAGEDGENADAAGVGASASASASVKFIDFSGSGIDGHAALVCYEWCAYRPNDSRFRSRPDPSKATDIFALGSTLFEIEGGKVPFHELLQGHGQDHFALMRAAEGRFMRREYPVDLGQMVLGDVIRRCWDGKYGCMVDVVGDVERVFEEYRKQSHV